MESVTPLSGRVLDPLNRAIPIQVKTIILVANTPIILSSSLLEKLSCANQTCLFIHHNHAQNLHILRDYYPSNSGEMLFIRGNGPGYWGLTNNIGSPFMIRTQKSHIMGFTFFVANLTYQNVLKFIRLIWSG